MPQQTSIDEDLGLEPVDDSDLGLEPVLDEPGRKSATLTLPANKNAANPPAATQRQAFRRPLMDLEYESSLGMPVITPEMAQQAAAEVTTPIGPAIPRVSGAEVTQAIPILGKTGGDIVAGVSEAGADVADFLRSPAGIATLGVGAAPSMGRALGVGFGLQGLSAIPDTYGRYSGAIEKGDVREAAKEAANLFIEGSMVVGGAAAIRPTKPVTTPQERATQPITSTVVEGMAKEAPKDIVIRELPEQPQPVPIERINAQEPNPSAGSIPIESRISVEPPAEGRVPARTEVPPAQTEIVPHDIADLGAVPVREPVGPGMGAAIPAEFERGGGRPTATKYRQIDIERQERGLEPIPKPQGVSDQATLDRAMAAVDLDPALPERLVAELRERPRVIEDWENHVLLLREIDLRNEFEKAARAAHQAFDDGRMDQVPDLNARTQEWSNLLTENEEALRLAGSRTGAALRARQVLVNEDFSLAAMETRLRAARGGEPITPDERVKLTKIADEYRAEVERLRKIESEKDARIAEAFSKAEFERIEKEAAKANLPKPNILRLAEEIGKRIEVNANESRKWLAGKTFSLDPEVMYHVARVGLDNIYQVGKEFGTWSARMVEELGDRVKPHLAAIFKESQKLLEETLSPVGAAKADGVRKVVNRGKTTDKAEVIESIKTKASAGEINDIYPLVQKLLRPLMEQGIRTRDGLIDAVHAIIRDIDPELTRRDAMDAISGYGRFKQLTKDELSVQLRDLKGQMQQLGKLEDMQSGQAPQKTGVERRLPSDEERRLIKQVEEAKKKGGYVVTDPATQLRSALQSQETRLRNQIADLEQEIATRTQIVRQKSNAPTSPEIDRLKARRDQLKAEHESIFGTQLTDAQRLSLAIRADERVEVEWNQRLRDAQAGNFDSKAKQKGPTSPELEAIRARTEAVREQVKELKELDQTLQAERAKERLERQAESLRSEISDLENRLSSGNVEPTPTAQRINRPSSPTLEPLIQQREALRKRLSDARRKPEDVRLAEQLERRLRKMDESIAEKRARLARGDIAPEAGSANRPMSPELEVRKQELEALNKQIADARRPNKTPEQIALQGFKTRVANELARVQEKIAAGDFTTRKPKEITLDAEAKDARFKLDKLKAEYNRLKFEDMLKRQTAAQKGYRMVKEAMNTIRSFIVSQDLSALLRQGSFILGSRPVMATKNLPVMFKSLATGTWKDILTGKGGEKYAHGIMEEIKARPNAPLYERSKLYLAEEGSSLAKMEEVFMSRIAEKIPGVRATQRAYVTFLNKLRADAFDAMLASLAPDGKATQPQLEAISNYVNVATGRGALGKSMANAGELLNTFFFAPRFVVSRFQYLLGQPLAKAARVDAKTRNLIGMEYARYLASLSVIYALWKAGGGDIGTDPRSSDFGKLIIGDTRIDLLAGLAQPAVFLARMLTGKTTTAAGETKPIDGRLPLAGRFARTKLAPIPGTIVDIDKGKHIDQTEVTPGSVAKRLAMPLSQQNLMDNLKTLGVPEAVGLYMLEFFGASVQNYAKEPK